jgi:hypothetical protein
MGAGAEQARDVRLVDRANARNASSPSENASTQE